MPYDARSNFAVSRVAVAPSPPSTGSPLDVQSGDGALFPAAPFNVTVWPYGEQPSTVDAEILRVTAKEGDGDTFEFLRSQEGTSARTILVGDWVALTVTARTLKDLELRGAQTPPSVPTSGTPLANPFSCACLVTVRGGTVTDVAVDGNSLGLVAGTVVVPYASTVAVTYAVVPTWDWFGLA